MKAVTIKQPWASLIVEPDLDNPGFGIKPIENRTWPTKFRGKVLVHAGQSKWDAKFLETFTHEQRNKFFKIDNFVLPYGAIIGSVEIVDCVINHPSIWAEKSKKLHEL